jgi:lipopolysaccharide export system permease protein
MNRIDRYLFMQFLGAVGFTCLAITVVVWFSQGIRLLSLVINNGGSVWSFFALMVLILPTFLPLVLPASLAIGMMFVFHRLITESELVVMRASGMNALRLARPALILATLIMLLGYMLTTVIGPIANHEFVRLQYQIRNDLSVLLLHTGGFNDVSKGLTFYARERGPKGDLKGILIHDTRKAGHPATVMAETGELVHAPEGPRILVHNGMQQEMDEKTGLLSQLSFDTYMVDLSSLADNFDSRFVEPRERPTFSLLNPPPGLETPVLNKFASEFHMRLVLPFVAIPFALIVCIVALTGNFDRRGILARVAVGAIVATLIEAGVLVVFNITVKQPSLAPFFYLVAFGPAPFFYQRLAAESSLKLGKPMKESAA